MHSADEVLYVKQGMEYALDDPEFYKETLEIYLEETKKNSELMKVYLDAGDLPNYAILAHSMKSSSRLVGGILVTELAEKLEMQSKDGNMEYVVEHHPELLERLHNLHEAIHAYIEKNN